MYMLVSAEVRRGHQIPLKLELQAVVSHHVGAGSRTNASGRVARALYHRVNSPVHNAFLAVHIISFLGKNSTYM